MGGDQTRFTRMDVECATGLRQADVESLVKRGLAPSSAGGGRGSARTWDSDGLAQWAVIGAARSVGVGPGTAARLGADLRERGWLHGLASRGGHDVLGPPTGDRYRAYCRAAGVLGVAFLDAPVVGDTYMDVTDMTPAHVFCCLSGSPVPDQSGDAAVLRINLSLAVRRAYERGRQSRCGGADHASVSAGPGHPVPGGDAAGLMPARCLATPRRVRPVGRPA